MLCKEAPETEENRLSREILLFGDEKVSRLRNARVALFGLGGVGSYCAEALARAGVGFLTLCDGDRINVTNINRQLYALDSTVGMYKTDAAEQRIKDINPEIKVEKKTFYYGKDNEGEFNPSDYDYVADAIDSVTSKILIAVKCFEAKVPEISCMGTGNKLHPEMLETDDIYNTSVCPLARVMRYELKKRGVLRLETVYSKEKPAAAGEVIGSTSFVPPAAGMIMAGKIIRDLIRQQ